MKVEAAILQATEEGRNAGEMWEMRPFGALQAAEKLIRAVDRGFIPGTKPMESKGASAPEVCFSQYSFESRSFSAACLAPAVCFSGSSPASSHFPAACKARTFQRIGFSLARLAAMLFFAMMAATGCHSYHVDTTVENRTGARIRLLEVDYPSASFGADTLGPGAVFHYRIQLQGSGPLKVQYTAGDGRQAQMNGPAMAERQEGQLQIVLLPGGKAEFHPDLTLAR